MSPAQQSCPDCGSPLDPCRCERDRGREAWNSTLRVYPKKKRKRRGKAETKAEKFAREFHSEERVAFVNGLPCCACGRKPTRRHPSDNHHVWTDGTGRRGPYTAIVPLCRSCHRRYHQIGKLSMLQGVRLQLRVGPTQGPRGRTHYFDQWEEVAAFVEEQWQAHANP